MIAIAPATKAIVHASKSEECPHCGKPGWCYSLGELTVCKRDADPASGWEKTSKSDGDGTPYYAPFSPKKEFRAKAKTEFIYRDRNGQPCVKVTRIDDGNGKKNFYQSSWDGKNWAKGLSAEARQLVPVYRYPEIREAIAAGQKVFWVEGEGIADQLWDIGISATTTLGGSKGYRKYGDYSTDLEDADLVLCPDRDKPGIAYMAEVAEDYSRAKWLYAPSGNFWANLPDSGGLDIGDWIKSGITIQQIMDSITDRIREWERLLSKTETESNKKDVANDENKPHGGRIPKADIFATEIAAECEGKIIWNNEHKSWMIYEHKHPGVWSAVDNYVIETRVEAILAERGIAGWGSDSYITNICKSLSRRLGTLEWNERQGVLPFEDGVALIGSSDFEEHSPDNWLTWCLPRRYFTPVVSDWGTIRAWMSEAWSDSNDREILLHFMAAVLNRRHDLQKFLYLVGTGGAGKGTYTRLLQSVIGDRNVWAGQVESLSNSNETFRLVGKLLAVFADQDKVTSGTQLFKNLTGGDILSAKQLYKDGFNFNFEGLALMTANAPALMGAGSWIKRRAIVVSCTHQAAVERSLDDEFKPEIAAFTKYLLSISNADIDRVLRDQRPTSGAVDPAMWEVLQRQDSIAAWIEECVTFDPQATTAIGSNKDEVIEDPTLATLFGSYHKFCRGTGLQGKSKSNFSPELEEMAHKVLGKKFVIRHRTKTGRMMIGVRLRSPGSPYYSDSLIPGDDLVTTDDDLGDDLGDDLKPLLHKEGDEGDDQTKEKLSDKSHSSNFENKSSPSQNTQTIEEGRHHIVTASQNADTVIVSENEQVVTTSSPASSPTEPQILIGCDVPLVVGKKVKCYPTATHAERRYSVTATIISVEVGGDYFAGCTIKYWDKKSEQYQTGPIGGGSGDWILKSV